MIFTRRERKAKSVHCMRTDACHPYLLFFLHFLITYINCPLGHHQCYRKPMPEAITRDAHVCFVVWTIIIDRPLFHIDTRYATHSQQYVHASTRPIVFCYRLGTLREARYAGVCGVRCGNRYFCANNCLFCRKFNAKVTVDVIETGVGAIKVGRKVVL